MTAGKNADAELTFFLVFRRLAFTYSSQGLLVYLMACLFCSKNQLSYSAPYWAKLQPPELPCTLLNYCILLSYCTLLWAMLHSLRYFSLSWATLHFTVQCCILVSFAAPFWTTLFPLSFAAPLWATMHPLSYAASYWAKMHPTKLRCTLLRPATHC